MTCIVAIETATGAIIGTDSAAVDHTGEVDLVDEPKWVITPNYIAVWAGAMNFTNFYTKHKVRHKRAAETPKQYAQYLANTWRGITPGMKDLESEVLLVIAGKVFYLQGDWSVYRSAHGYSAAGSGSQVALGSLFSTLSMPTKDRVIQALAASAMHCNSVAKPLHVLEIDGKKKTYTLVE